MNKTLALCLTLFASPLAAHPHIFVSTGLSFVLDGENRLTHVQVTWEYDELYSLLVTEDMGVDSERCIPEIVCTFRTDGDPAGWQDCYHPSACRRGGAQDHGGGTFFAL